MVCQCRFSKKNTILVSDLESERLYMCEGRECMGNIYTALCFVVYLKLLNKVL